MSKRLHSRRLTRMQKKSIVSNLYTIASVTFQRKYFERLNRGLKKLELGRIAKKEAAKEQSNKPTYTARMVMFRDRWVNENSMKRDSFLAILSEDRYENLEDESFFKLLDGLGFKGIDHERIEQDCLLYGYYEECDPEANTESEFDTENGPESKDKKREEESSIEDGEEDVTNSIDEQRRKESEEAKELV